MSDRDADTTVDRRLIDVPMPDRLLSRLRGIAAVDDAELDFRLRAVPVPDGLASRLQHLAADGLVDEQICEVAIPSHFVPRVRTIPNRRRRSSLAQAVLAACLMLMISTGYLTGLGGVLGLFWPGQKKKDSIVVVDAGPLDLVGRFGEVFIHDNVNFAPLDTHGDVFIDDSEVTRLIPDVTKETFIDQMPLGPAGQLAAEIPNVWDPSDNWMLMRWGVSGYSRVAEDAAPELIAVQTPLAAGWSAPLARSFDREFLYRRGTHPPMLTSGGNASCTVSPPLTTDTGGLLKVQQLIRDGRRVEPESIRTEDFLAGIDYQFAPAAPGALAIRTAAGPSIFSRSAAALVQVGVKAGACPHRPSGGTHLTLALDTSNAMKRQGRLELACYALQKVLPHLGHEDRISLVIFSDEAVKIVEEAGSSDWPKISRILDQLDCSGDANLGAGLGEAISASIETESENCVRRRLALITASRPYLTEKAASGVRQMFTEAARDDFQFDVFDLAPDATASSVWSSLAAEAQCTVHSVRTADQLCWPMVEVVTSAPSLVANEVSLQVKFNPKAVAAYRLMGHEATALGGLLPGSAKTDLHVGEEATVLFEVWRYPNDEDNIADVQLSWIDAATGQSRQTGQQRISAIQFATSFEGSPLSLQAAAIAAETAEVFRQSFNFAVMSPNSYRYQPKPIGLSGVLDTAERANTTLAERPSFQRLVRLLDQAESIRVDRKSVLAHSGRRGIIAGRWRESRD